MPKEDDHEGDLHRNSSASTYTKSIRWKILCSALLLAEIEAALESTMTANLQPVIIHTFGEISKFPWINVTYSLGGSGLCLLWGKLVCFDSKTIFLVARLFFATGNALTAAAPSMNAFIIGRAITGIGNGGTYVTIIIIITHLTPRTEQGRYFGYIGFAWGLGTILGPPIGGAFAVTAAGWRWSFYLNLIVTVVFVPVFWFLLPSCRTSAPSGSVWTRICHIDILGCVLFAGALTSSLMVLSFGGALYAWSSRVIIGLFCCTCALWLLFIVQQATTTLTKKRTRILPIHILKSLEMWLLIIQIGCSIGVLFITIFYIPLYFQFVRGESAIRSGVHLLPYLFTTVVAMLISGRLIMSYGHYKLWFVAGSSLTLIMSACLYTIEVDTPHGRIYAYLIIGGIGCGLYSMNAGPVMAARVAKEYVSDASAIFACVDTLCGTLAVGVTNSIFINQATSNIQKVLPGTPRATVQDAIAGVGASLTDQLSPQLKFEGLQAVLNAIKDAWVQMIATAALSLVLSLFLRKGRLSELSRS